MQSRLVIPADADRAIGTLDSGWARILLSWSAYESDVCDPMTSNSSERFDIAINTPAGQLTTGVEIPTGFVPVTAIVPLMRRLGEEVQALEIARSVESQKVVSCRKGCAACCRMLVPLSIPEALALREWVNSLEIETRQRIQSRLDETKSVLTARGLWHQLAAWCDRTEPPNDDMAETLNREYYTLQIACPFLEQECCSIYEQRPAACRELLVSSPPERCADVIQNSIEPISVPVRISTVLGLLWQELTATPATLIPLPLALEWAERHQHENERMWKGTELVDTALDKVWRFLSQSFQGQSENVEP